MYAKILAVLAGTLAHELVFFDSFGLASAVTIAGAVYVFLTRQFLYAWFYLGGCLFSAAHLYWIAAHQLPFEDSGELFWVAGTVTQVDRATDSTGSSFILTAKSASKYAGQAVAIQKLYLSSYGRIRPETHQECGFYVRLKPPVGVRNPGGRNREMFYFVKRISALGYVIEHPRNRCTTDTKLKPVDQLRQTLFKFFEQLAVSPESKAVLMSLALAERDKLSAQQWEIFQRTGTAHLLAISGLHISLVAALVFYAVRSLLLVMKRRSPAQIYGISLFCAAAACASYAALSGFLLPTQRALAVVLVSAFALVRGRQVLSFETLIFSALLVATLDPLAMLTLGFWMSFSAVGILISLRAVRPLEHWLVNVFQTHCFLSLGTLPLTMLINETLPVSAPLANFIAVPVTCFFIVPLILLGVVLAILALPGYTESWRMAAFVWEYVWQFLLRLDDYSPTISLVEVPNAWQLALMVLGTAVLIIPLLPYRWIFAGLCYGQIFLASRAGLNAGEWRLLTLDVGQGLASIVETANHVVVFDTGPSRGEYSAGRSIVRPALRSLGQAKIDKLIVSHGDNDHAGGLAALKDEFSLLPAQILTAEPAALSSPSVACRAGQEWVWDGVRFSIIAPFKHAGGSENDRSCVMKIDGKFGSGLLPGDIESSTEGLLLARCSRCLEADILIAPHHGSNTSSTPEFVRAVSPRIVIFAAGYQNRFDFPAAAVAGRYHDIGAQTFVTGYDGAIYIDVSEAGIDVATARRSPLANDFR